MPAAFPDTFAALKTAFDEAAPHLNARVDTSIEYTLVGRVPSPFPQDKKQPVYFGSVRLGKSYVSFHLMPLYMNEEIASTISPTLKKRMQGKTCFNFKSVPDARVLAELQRLTELGLASFRQKEWI